MDSSILLKNVVKISQLIFHINILIDNDRINKATGCQYYEKYYFKKTIDILLRKMIGIFYTFHMDFLCPIYPTQYTNCDYMYYNHTIHSTKIDISSMFNRFNYLSDKAYNINIKNVILIRYMKYSLSKFIDMYDKTKLYDYRYDVDSMYMNNSYNDCVKRHNMYIKTHINHGVDYLAMFANTIYCYRSLKNPLIDDIKYTINHGLSNSTVRYVRDIYHKTIDFGNSQVLIPDDIFRKILSFIYARPHTVDMIIDIIKTV